MHVSLTINGHHVNMTALLTPSGYFCGFDVAKAGLEIDRFEKIYIGINVTPDGFYDHQPPEGKQLEAENYTEKRYHDGPATPGV
jgi:hypothetical protein